MSSPHTCPTCSGTKKRDGEDCPTCSATGVVWQTEEAATDSEREQALDLTYRQ